MHDLNEQCARRLGWSQQADGTWCWHALAYEFARTTSVQMNIAAHADTGVGERVTGVAVPEPPSRVENTPRDA